MADFSVGWGSNLDMLSLAHGAVGCSAFALTQRLHLPGFAQGIESFTALDACTDLKAEDLKDNGNAKLSRAIDEVRELFPLARGIALGEEEPVALIRTDIRGIIKTNETAGGKPIIAWNVGPASMAAAVRAVARRRSAASQYDVALCFRPQAAGLIWIISQLLRDIGLNPIHVRTSSSISDLARIEGCKLIIDHAHRLDVPTSFRWQSASQSLKRLLGIPLVWACFTSPPATDASLRTIASHFDWRIQRRAEAVIATNRQKVDAIIARYRPRLEGKLFLNINWPYEEAVESYRLLGMRIGDETNWPGKKRELKTPRAELRWGDDISLSGYLRETEADLVSLCCVDEYEWRKRGLPGLSTPAFLAYDGFGYLAIALDRHVNAPWRKLVKPPWPEDSG